MNENLLPHQYRKVSQKSLDEFDALTTEIFSTGYFFVLYSYERKVINPNIIVYKLKTKVNEEVIGEVRLSKQETKTLCSISGPDFPLNELEMEEIGKLISMRRLDLPTKALNGRYELIPSSKNGIYLEEDGVDDLPSGTQIIIIHYRDYHRKLRALQQAVQLYNNGLTEIERFIHDDNVDSDQEKDANLSRLEEGIINAYHELEKERMALTDEAIGARLTRNGILNKQGESYTREWVNKTRNNLIDRGHILQL